MNQRLTASQAEKTKKITMIGLMTAVTCILGPLSLPLPFSPVPITLTNFAVFLSIYILGMKYGTISLLIYLALGTIGLPVFSSYSGGILWTCVLSSIFSSPFCLFRHFNTGTSNRQVPFSPSACASRFAAEMGWLFGKVML